MKKYLFFAIMALSWHNSFAYNFVVDGIYYNITSASNLTVEVTYGPSSYPNTHECVYIGDIVIPETTNYNGSTYTITGIGDFAFYTSYSQDYTNYNNTSARYHLTSIELPPTIEYIGRYSFCNCLSLKSIDLVKCQKIGQAAFKNCTFLSLTVPKTVVQMDDHCLNTSLKELIMLPTVPPSTSSYENPLGINTNTEILVPIREKYAKDKNWKSYNLVEMLTPSSRVFEYNGQVPSINWTNNLSAYTIELNDITLEKVAGMHVTEVKADFYKNGIIHFNLEFPYEYTINKAILNVKANDKSRVYGDDNPAFTLSYTGFVNQEDESEITAAPMVGTTANKSSEVGEYPITISSGSATNYEFIYEPGILTVTKAPLSAKVNDATKVYGAQNPAFTIEYYGLKNEETTPAWTMSPTFQTDATQSSGVGQYTVKAVNGVPVNYDLGEITDGTLNITPAPLTIKANDAVRQYYSDEPNYSYKCNGFVNSENDSVLTIKPVLSTTATRTSNVGTYEIMVGEASSPNYSISFVNGTLTIIPRTLMASVGNYERPYNEDDPVFEVKYNGFMGEDNETVLISKPEAKTTATRTSDVGTYPIDVTGGSADNYTFSYTSGTLTINKAEQTITWEQDFSSLSVDDQVELKAEASSGLPITYTMDQTNIAEIYSTGNKTYLDCKGEGTFQIVAVQNGDKNYYSTIRVRKTITIGNSSGINEIGDSPVKVQRTSYGIKVIDANMGDMIRVYTLDGLLQKSIRVDSKNVEILLKKEDVYIIKVGGKMVKLGF